MRGMRTVSGLLLSLLVASGAGAALVAPEPGAGRAPAARPPALEAPPGPASRPQTPVAPAREEREVRTIRPAAVAPLDVTAFVLLPRFSRLMSDWRALSVGRTLLEPEVAGIFTSALASLRDSAARSQKGGLEGFVECLAAAEVDWSPLAETLRSEVGIMILPPNEGTTPRVALALMLSGPVRSVETLVDSLVNEVVRLSPGYRTAHFSHGTYFGRTLVSQDFTITFAYYESLLLVGTGRNTVRELMDVSEKGGRSGLASDADYGTMIRNQGRGADVIYRVDLAGAGRLLAGLDDGHPLRAAQGLLLPRTGLLWGALATDGASLRERVSHQPLVESPVVGGADAVPALASPPRTLSYFSVDTALYATMSVNAQSFLAATERDPLLKAAFEAATSGARGLLDVDYDFDMVNALVSILGEASGEVGVGLSLPDRKPPELLVVISGRRTALEAAAKKLDAIMKPRDPRSEIYRSHLVVSAESPARSIGHVMRLGAYTVSGETLVMGSSRRAVLKAIRQRELAQSSLERDPRFMSLTGVLRARKTFLAYADPGRVLSYFAGAVPALDGDRPYEGPLAKSDFARAAAEHFGGLALAADLSSASRDVESLGPLGPFTALGLVAARGWSAGTSAEKDTWVDQDAANLRRIGVGLHLYATDFDRFPTKLSELFAGSYGVELRTFVAPGSATSIPSAEEIDARGDYVYVPGLSPLGLSGAVVVYGREPRDGLRNALLLDGSVARRLPEEEFQVRLRAQGIESRTAE